MEQEEYEARLAFKNMEELSGIVTTIHPEKGDVLVINIEISKMSPSKVTEYLNNIKLELKPVWPKNLKVIYTTMRDGQKTIEFDLLRFLTD